jgi:two-component system, chemotaxis family, sensor histidine kinase and response regulator PixL
MVRDMSLKYDKDVKVEIIGEETLVDRTVFEKLYDPLVHLVRNAFDHGIEPPEVRQQNGKPAQATITLRAYHKGHKTYLEIEDDGRGINLEAVRTKVINKGLFSAADAAKLSAERLYECLFMPGFSTATQVSELSGRGVGLDVVETQIKEIKGNVSIESVQQRGTKFLLRFPLTLTIAELLVFTLHNQTMAMAMHSVKSIVTVPIDQLISTSDLPVGLDPSIDQNAENTYFEWQGKKVPLYPRSVLLNHYPLHSNVREAIPAIPLPKLDDRVSLVIIGNADELAALRVDSILQTQELTIKPFGITVQSPDYLCGCTTLGDGSLIPVIDGKALLARSLTTPVQSTPVQIAKLPTESSSPPKHPILAMLAQKSNSQSTFHDDSTTSDEPDAFESTAHTTQTILVVDDSLTARQVLAFTLEKSGYEVLQAKDGREAVTQLKQNFDVIQAIFCDVEMPRMNGFEFLSHCQQEYGDTAPPIIMLTSRSGEKHRNLGQSLGASAYLTKPYLEQALINTLQKCINDKTKHQSTEATSV